MTIQDALKAQYEAALEMLRQAVVACPEALWEDRSYKNQFWSVAYHAAFYTDLYVRPSGKGFVPWAKHHKGHRLEDALVEPYSRQEVLEYLEVVGGSLAGQLALLDPEAPSEFPWLPCSRLEVQIYSLRHLQQHVGELCERLGATEGSDVTWVMPGSR